MRFRCHRNASIVRVRATVLIRFRLSTRQTFENDRIARRDASWTLCGYYNKRYFRSSFLFWCFFDRFWPSTNTIRMRFRFDPLSRAFLNRCVLNENAQCINLDGRLDACMRFRTRTALMLTGPKSVSCGSNSQISAKWRRNVCRYSGHWNCMAKWRANQRKVSQFAILAPRYNEGNKTEEIALRFRGFPINN